MASMSCQLQARIPIRVSPCGASGRRSSPRPGYILRVFPLVRGESSMETPRDGSYSSAGHLQAQPGLMPEVGQLSAGQAGRTGSAHSE